MNLSRLVITTFVVLLSACGGGGGSSPAPQESSVPEPAPVPVVALYGDSTQQPSAYSTTSTAIEAQKLLVGIATLVNEGVPGTYSQQLLDGTDGKHPAWDREMANSAAKVVVINHAINDHFYPTSQYRANLVSLVTIARTAGKTVMLETPNPIQTQAFSVADFEDRVQAMRDVAASLSVPLCDEYAAIVQAGLQTDNLDGYHPTPHLFAFEGQVLASCIRNAL